VLNRLENHNRDNGTAESPNLFAWELGQLACNSAGASYNVVLALARGAGTTNGALATYKTIERWKPRYVFLVGIAGGFDRDGLDKGDIILSDVIYGYEYGKLREQFEPRHDFTYRCDTSLITGARAFAINKEWADKINETRPDGIKRIPKLLFGPIASGDKVVDNLDQEFFAAVIKTWPKLLAVEMEGAGAAEAIELAKSGGDMVNFLMIRGISDMPPSRSEVKADTQTIERDKWKKYAAEVAATFAISYIKNGLPEPPSVKSIKPKEFENHEFPKIQEVLRKDEVTEGRFFRIEPTWADFEQKYVLERIEVEEIINNLDHNKIQLIIGEAGSGKSIALKTIGFRLSQYKTVYYIYFKKYDVTKLVRFLSKISKSNEKAIFILDDIHLHIEECRNSLKEYEKSGSGWIIIGAREISLFEGHPKYLSQFDNIKKIEIYANDIADRLIELYLKKNYDLDESKIAYVSERLNDYKNDLWLLSWALLAFKLEYTHADKIDIYNKVRDSILQIQGRKGMIDASNIFFVLSVFSRFEIPVEKGFLVSLGVESNQIDELVSLREILEDNHNGAISIVHSSIADIYFHAYLSFPELGRLMRINYKGDESYLLFHKYLTTKPFNFFGLFTQLCRESVDEKGGQALAKRLLDDALIRDEFLKMIDENNEIPSIILSLGKLKNINNRFILQVAESINIESLIKKLNRGSNFGISLFILLIKGINLPLVKNVIKRLDIRRIANKLKDENVYNILVTLMAFFNVDSNIASDLVNEMIDEKNIKRCMRLAPS
jgi:nucleoside phosphorylase